MTPRPVRITEHYLDTSPAAVIRLVLCVGGDVVFERWTRTSTELWHAHEAAKTFAAEQGYEIVR